MRKQFINTRTHTHTQRRYAFRNYQFPFRNCGNSKNFLTTSDIVFHFFMFEDYEGIKELSMSMYVCTLEGEWSVLLVWIVVYLNWEVLLSNSYLSEIVLGSHPISVLILSESKKTFVMIRVEG